MPERPTPGKPPGPETRQRLMDAGFALFSRKGLHGTNSREISAAAGVSIGTFYIHFREKRDLFITLLEMKRDRLSEILNGFSVQAHSGETLQTAIEELIRSVWTFYSSVHQFDLKAEALRDTDARIDRICEEQQEEISQHILSILSAAEPRLRPDQLETAAWLGMQIMTHGMCAASQLKSPADRDDALAQLIDVVMRYAFDR